jgi:hypothetical protein
MPVFFRLHARLLSLVLGITLSVNPVSTVASGEPVEFGGTLTAIGTFAPAGASCPGNVPFVRTYQYTFTDASIVLNGITGSFSGTYNIAWSDNCGGGAGVVDGSTTVNLSVGADSVSGSDILGAWTDTVSGTISDSGISGTWGQSLDDGLWTGSASGQFSLPRRSVALSSLSLTSAQILEGGTVTATVALTAPAPTSGATVVLQSDTIWPLSIETPDVATVPSSVVVPAGQLTATFDVHTEDVLFPLVSRIHASYGGVTKREDLTVEPEPTRENGRVANARVLQIVTYFLTSVGGATPQERYAKALSDAQTIRGGANGIPSSGTIETGQDIFLAAAEHYLVAADWVLRHPGQVVFVRGFVLVHELKKLLTEAGVTALPPSRPTKLSIAWGLQGVTDAVRILYGDQALKSKLCRLTGVCGYRFW